jgi:outer membrane protein assembly factor BamB
MRVVRLAGACLLMLLCAAPVFGQLRHDPLPDEDELARYGLTRAWWNRAVMDPGQDKVTNISADELGVYVQSTSGVVSAFDAETGRLMWAHLIGAPNRASYPMVSNDSTLFMTAGMKLYAIDKASGEVLWDIHLPHHPSTSPDVDEEHAYVGTVDGSVYAFNLARVQDLYDRRMLPQFTDLTLTWRYQTPSEIISSPVSNGEVVVFASFSGQLYSVVAENCTLNFQFETEGRAPIRVPFGRSDQTIFVASDDARVFALDMTSGNRKWSFTAGEPVREQPRVVGASVFVVPDGRGMHSLRTTTGFQNWRQPRATKFLAATPDLVYASDRLDNLLLVNREDGVVTAVLPYRHLPVRVQNERTDRLYMANEAGLVVCVREASREQPLWHMFPERQPIRAEVAPDEPAEETGTEPAP